MATSRKGSKTTTTKKKTVKKTAKKTPQVKIPEPKVEVAPVQPSQAEIICSNVKDDIRPQAVTLANAVLAMQSKIEQQIPKYKRTAFDQKVKLGTGETVLRSNPIQSEFRATVREYAAALNTLQTILSENKAPTQVSDMESLRNKFKMAK